MRYREPKPEHRFEIFFVETSAGQCPAKKYLDSLEKRRRAKLDALLDRIALHGKINNREQFKKLIGYNIYEIKNFQDRLFGFFDEKRFVVTNGFIKKKNDTPKAEIDRALKNRELYFKKERGGK